jgi:hypothetical protein
MWVPCVLGIIGRAQWTQNMMPATTKRASTADRRVRHPDRHICVRVETNAPRTAGWLAESHLCIQLFSPSLQLPTQPLPPHCVRVRGTACSVRCNHSPYDIHHSPCTILTFCTTHCTVHFETLKAPNLAPNPDVKIGDAWATYQFAPSLTP